MAWGAPTASAKAASNACTFGPLVSQPEAMTSSTDARIASVTRSLKKGTCMAGS